MSMYSKIRWFLCRFNTLQDFRGHLIYCVCIITSNTSEFTAHSFKIPSHNSHVIITQEIISLLLNRILIHFKNNPFLTKLPNTNYILLNGYIVQTCDKKFLNGIKHQNYPYRIKLGSINFPTLRCTARRRYHLNRIHTFNLFLKFFFMRK